MKAVIIYSLEGKPTFNPQKAFRYLEYAYLDHDQKAKSIVWSLNEVANTDRHHHLLNLFEENPEPLNQTSLKFIALCFKEGYKVQKGEEMATRCLEKAKSMKKFENVFLVEILDGGKRKRRRQERSDEFE